MSIGELRKKVRSLLVNGGYITPKYPFMFMKRASMREIGQNTCDTALCCASIKFGTSMNPVGVAEEVSDFLSKKLPSNGVRVGHFGIYVTFTFLQGNSVGDEHECK